MKQARGVDQTPTTMHAAPGITRRALLPMPLLLSWAVPASAASPGAERIATALADMTLPHEVVPLGVGENIGWKRRPGVAANTEPYGEAIPSYWKGKRFAEWRAMLPWFVIYEGEPANPAVNVQVELSGIECWVLLQSTRQWVLAGAATRPAWDSVYAPNAVDRIAADAAGRVTEGAVRYTPRTRAMVHGGLAQVPVPWHEGKADIRALYVSARHRLLVRDEAMPDDRLLANIGLQVGLDYYPWVGARLADLQAAYVPGAGLGRFLKVTSAWRYSSLVLRKAGVAENELTDQVAPAFRY